MDTVLAAIQVTPEAADGGLIACIEDGDIISIDAESGILKVDADLKTRQPREHDLSANEQGMGRELFGVFRKQFGAAETCASIFSEVT